MSVSLTTPTQQMKSPAMLQFLPSNLLLSGISVLKWLHGCSLSLQGAWRRVSRTSSTRWIRCRRAWLMLTRLTSARSVLSLPFNTHTLPFAYPCPAVPCGTIASQYSRIAFCIPIGPLDARAVPPVPCGSTHRLSILTHSFLATQLCPLDALAVPPVPCGTITLRYTCFAFCILISAHWMALLCLLCLVAASPFNPHTPASCQFVCAH